MEFNGFQRILRNVVGGGQGILVGKCHTRMLVDIKKVINAVSRKKSHSKPNY
jgi:hypothetical protein